jgi:hypothetical protein
MSSVLNNRKVVAAGGPRRRGGARGLLDARRGATDAAIDLISLLPGAQTVSQWTEPGDAPFTVRMSLAGESHKAVFAPAFSRIRWKVQVPRRGTLEVLRRGRTGGRAMATAVFSVGVSDGRTFEEFVREAVNLKDNDRDRRWLSATIDPAVHEGQLVELNFNTIPARGATTRTGATTSRCGANPASSATDDGTPSRRRGPMSSPGTGQATPTMQVPMLDLQAQYRPIRDAIIDAVTRVCDSQRFIMGPEVDGMEREMAAYLGVTHAVGVSSGTDALLLARWRSASAPATRSSPARIPSSPRPGVSRVSARSRCLSTSIRSRTTSIPPRPLPR